MMLSLPYLFVAVLFSTAASLSVQDPKKSDVFDVLAKFSSTDVGLDGTIVQEEPEEASDPPRIRFPASFEYAAFVGEVKVGVMKDSSLILVSKATTPSIKIYRRHDQFLCTQTHSEDPFDAKKTVNSISNLLDWKALAIAIEASNQTRVISKDNETDFRVVLDPAFVTAIPSQANKPAPDKQKNRVADGSDGLKPKPIDLTATFTFSPSKELVRVSYEIQYDDPIKGLSKKMNGGMGIFGFRADKPPKLSEVTLGKLVRMVFTIEKSVPSDVISYSQEAKKLLAN